MRTFALFILITIGIGTFSHVVKGLCSTFLDYHAGVEASLSAATADFFTPTPSPSATCVIPR